MILEKTISKLIVKFPLSETRDALVKLWDSNEKVSTKVLTRFLKAKIKISIKSNRQKVEPMLLNDQKHKTKILCQCDEVAARVGHRKGALEEKVERVHRLVQSQSGAAIFSPPENKGKYGNHTGIINNQ